MIRTAIIDATVALVVGFALLAFLEFRIRWAVEHSFNDISQKRGEYVRQQGPERLNRIEKHLGIPPLPPPPPPNPSESLP